MFSSGLPLMVFGVLLGLTLIVTSVYFVNKILANNTQELLVKYILLVFTALVSVWIVDKVIAFKINLLSTAQNENLFDLIKTLILMIFSYYFGTKNNSNNNK